VDSRVILTQCPTADFGIGDVESSGFLAEGCVN
jgi:hypothetical protein